MNDLIRTFNLSRTDKFYEDHILKIKLIVRTKIHEISSNNHLQILET